MAREPRLTSLSELDDVLAQARVEGWRELALLGPRAWAARPDRVPKAHTFRLRERLGARISRLTVLTGLTSLGLSDNQIGADGAHALVALTGLTSLDLSDNQIGDDGARALDALTGLTSLVLSGNQVGDEGARDRQVVSTDQYREQQHHSNVHLA